MAHSREFLEQMVLESRKYLPKVLYDSMIKAARASAGGRGKARKVKPSAVEKLGLTQIMTDNLKKTSDDELKEIWEYLSEWYNSAVKSKDSTDSIVNAATEARKEFKSRNIATKACALETHLRELEQPLIKQMHVLPSGPDCAPVAFVGASLDRIEKARQEQFVGSCGLTFKEKYLVPLGLKKQEVFLSSIVPLSLAGANGEHREPQQEEIEKWGPVQIDEIRKADPLVVVALGKTAANSLGDLADFKLPHPATINKFGDSGEISRKLKKVKTAINKASIKKAESWIAKLAESTENNFSITPNDTKSRLYTLKFANNRFDITHEKTMESLTKDDGQFKIGTVHKSFVELFLDGKSIKGRYCLKKSKSKNDSWLIEKPEKQDAFCETISKADLSKQLKNSAYLIYSGFEEKPVLHNLQTNKIEKSENVQILKAADKQIVYGVVLDPYGKNGPQEDAHLDWNPPNEIEQTAHDFMQGPKVIGIQHQKQANAKLLENWIEPYPSKEDYIAAMDGRPHKVYRRKFGDDILHSGSWVVGVQLGDAEWKLFQDGKINAFSPGGIGVREPLKKEDMPKVTFVDLVEKAPVKA
jgi:uracil-DNA glycosylase family 4